MRNAYWLIFGAVSILFTQGCALGRDNAGAPLAKMTYAHVDPLILNVGRFTITDQASVSFKAKRGDGFAPNPLEITKNYFTRRFIASGVGTMHLEASIAGVDVSYSQREDDTPLSALLGKKDQYDITVNIRLKVQNDIGKRASVGFTAKRSVSIPSHFSVVEREVAQQQAMDHLMLDIDSAVRTHLANDFGVLSRL